MLPMVPGQMEIATDTAVRIEKVNEAHENTEDIAVLDYLKTIEDREEVLDDFKEICQKTPEHDMCKKHGSHYHCPSNSDDFLQKPFTDDQKAEMLYFTNEKRSLIANGTESETGASNMREMSWDKCLETVAQRWADQCVNGHDHIAERECPGFKSGKFWYKTIIVCNYGPMGNTNHRSMYEEGTACAKCPTGFESCNNSLCKAN